MRSFDALIASARAGDTLALGELAERAKSGRPAMEALLVALAPKIERFGRRLCGAHSADVDDTLQDAMLAVAQHLGSFEGKSALSSWVFAVVRSACSRHRRGLKNQQADLLDEGLADTAMTPDASLERTERVRVVERALDALPVEQREVLLLRDVEGLSAEEAASVIGIGVPALKSRLHRARAALRAELAPAFAPSSVAPDASCPDVLSALSNKLEDDLAPQACTLLEAHVRTCAACGALCDTLKGALGVCHQLGVEGPTEAREAELRAIVRRAVASVASVSGR